MRRFVAFLASLALLVGLAAQPAAASPLPFYNVPFSSVQDAVNSGVIAPMNSTYAAQQTLVACSGTTTATCQGLRMTVSITGLSTAASTLSAAMTVTDASVTAASQITCSTNVYAGTGIPIPVNIIPAAGSFVFAIQNISTGAALNATVPVQCIVWN